MRIIRTRFPTFVRGGQHRETSRFRRARSPRLRRYHKGFRSPRLRSLSQGYLNGKELETRFVSAGEIEATVPQQAVKEAGTYTVMVVGQGDFASKSGPAYLIVSFKK